ncbi:hypothetical protein LCS78_17015 [Vibrio harveyi]|uniref:hypothetical protein n=1 Tax=Vibrio harveyi TaxID=669 RepID=UPI00237F35E7|nr:hypothetical protein [Vibrio harveyi]HDM8068680.1 hypothetical protein [Vibrio harveyi]
MDESVLIMSLVSIVLGLLFFAFAIKFAKNEKEKMFAGAIAVAVTFCPAVLSFEFRRMRFYLGNDEEVMVLSVMIYLILFYSLVTFIARKVKEKN